MRPRYNRYTWKVRHIAIEFDCKLQSMVASRRIQLTKDKFIDELVDFLIKDGYWPRMPVDVMKKKMKSPYSKSESYIFLKSDEAGNRIKLVLDIRWSDHALNEWENYSARDRKLHHIEQNLPDIQKETGLDTSGAIPQFIDVVEVKNNIIDLVSVDGELLNNYSEALEVIKTKVIEFDERASK